nr:hypothetical protein [Suaeda aralocaspica]
MSHVQEHENDGFLWENQSWENLANGTLENSGSEKAVLVTEPKEDKRKGKEKMVEEGEKEEMKGKKRGRSATTRRGRKENNGGKKKEGELSDHELHIWTERERRKRMRNMFQNLHLMLPQLPSKADKSTIVDEAVNYIRTLQSTLQRLQKKKLDRLQGVGPSNPLPYEPSVAATSRLAMISSRETFMADQVSSMNNNNSMNPPRSSIVHSASTSHLLPAAIQTWTSPNVVLNICGNDAQFSVYAPKKLGLFAAICCVFDKYKLEVKTANMSTDLDRSIYMIHAQAANGATDQFPENVTVEEIYKHAAGEMMLWTSS